MLRVREIVEELRVFESSKVPFEVKILGIATYIQTSSLGEDCYNSLSELHPVSKTSLWSRGVWREIACLYQRRILE
ncbi:MAG: hypothetical protein ACXQTL_04295 [Methanosarcinales archaeon]